MSWIFTQLASPGVGKVFWEISLVHSSSSSVFVVRFLGTALSSLHLWQCCWLQAKDRQDQHPLF